jgi:hemerythrin superfamily protein
MDQQPTETSSETVADAVDLLTRDHRLIDELFAGFFEAAPQQLDPLARRLCKMIRIHMRIVDEIFYPAVRRALDANPSLGEARTAHDDIMQAVMRIESLTSSAPEFNAAVESLRELLTAHVESEEHELFPQVRAAKIDLVSLGQTLSERRDTLMDVLGLHVDDEEGAANMRDLQRPAAARAAVLRQMN